MKRECESCIKRKTAYCPTSMKCMATDDMPYYQNRIMFLEQQCKKQKEVIDKASNTLERGITFCENDSQGVYDTCNIAINREKKVLDILKEVSE